MNNLINDEEIDETDIRAMDSLDRIFEIQEERAESVEDSDRMYWLNVGLESNRLPSSM